MGRGMMILFWVALLAVAYLFFADFEEGKRNPNREVQTAYSDSYKEVVLRSARYGHYIASGTINEQPVTFMVDTGASFVSVPETVAKRIGLVKGSRMQTHTAAGTVTVYGTHLDKVSIGDITVYDVQATINPHNDSDELLLGMSFLKKLEMLHREGELRLRQRL
jgi:aspartyl protease family protein